MTTAYEMGNIPPSRLQYRLRIAREEAALDRSELADNIGVSVKTISNSERGITQPRKILLNAWALATGVPISWLAHGIGDWQPPSDDGAVRPEGFEPPTF